MMKSSPLKKETNMKENINEDLPIHPNEFLYDNDTIENKTKIDNDYEETYGKIYKPIDIRYLKSKIYSVLKDMKT